MGRVHRFGLSTLVVLSAVLASVSAQPPKPAPAPAVPPSTSEATKQQEENLKFFKEFKAALLRLALRYEASDRPEDKARGKTVRAALELAEKEGVDAQFAQLVTTWRSNPNQVQQFDTIIGKDVQLAKALAEILNILQTDDETARIKAEIAKLAAFMKELKDLKKRQEIVRAKTDAQKGDPKPIAESQKDLAKQTKDVADRMGGEKKAGGDGDKKEEISKAEPKAEAKPGDESATDKPDTGEDKSESKDAPSDPGEAKPGDPKAGGEPKPGESKAGEPKAGEPKSGEPKAGEAKPMAPKPGPEAKSKDGESKPGESKPGEPKSGDPKGGGESKPGGKPGEAGKPGEYAEGKAGDPAGAEAKGSARGKGSDKPSAPQNGGEGKGIGGTPKDEPPGESKSGGGGSPGQGGEASPPPPQNPNQAPGRKSVQEAYPHQQEAEEELKKNARPKASKQQDSAIEKLAKAIEELEKRLKQLREEEMLKLLANLEARCSQMLRMQTEVYESTKQIHAGILKNSNQKGTADHQKSQQQAEREREIVVEAEKALKLLEAEGSAVAFARVLEEVRDDMVAVKRRLDATVVDTDTQAIEENVIAMLKDMIAALKKAQQDIQDGKNDPNNNQNSGKQNQKLINLLQELKLVRAMQLQVNTRTKMYGNKTPGEQSADPIVSAELKQLSARQAKLQDMLQKITAGMNQ
jgi:hypothetical protein